MAADWALEEMRTVDLKDARTNARLLEILTQLGARSSASIPEACGGHAEMTAAYRLFDNDKVTFQGILEPHQDRTRERVAAQKTVLLVQDTTEIDLTRPAQQVEGAGPLDGGARQGLLLHLLHAFTPDGTPLGTLDAHPWARDAGKPPNAKSTRAQRAAIPIEEKESHRWVRFLRIAALEAARSPGTRHICLSDSEGDIYELLASGLPSIDWIVRACQDRALVLPQEETPAAQAENQTPAQAAGEGTGRAKATLQSHLLAQPVLYTQTIQVRGRERKIACEKRGRRQPRLSREARVEVRSASVTLRPPWRSDRQLPAATVNAVLVSEIDPPGEDTPIQWLLLTSLPVADADQAREVVEFYCGRWMIEVLFRVLKSGCRVEERRFENLDRVLNCLAVYLIIAWRSLYVCRLGRACPEMDCQAIFEPEEWKSVWKVMRNTNPPDRPPPLGEIIILVAQLGGYVVRKNSPPGPQTIWLGLQRTHDFAMCWKMFGPGAVRVK